MARVQLEFPASAVLYSTSITVRTTDLNFANHVGNDTMLTLVSEARSRFLEAFGAPETGGNAGADAGRCIGIIITDVAATYRAEAHARDALLFEIGVVDLNRYGGDIVYRITRPASGTLVALAKQGFVFFDYAQRKVAPMPDAFRARLSHQPLPHG